MKRYDIVFEQNREEGSGYIQVPIVGEIEQNESFGDQIGIYKENSSLVFDESLDIDDEDIQAFIKDNFLKPRAVRGFIRRIVQ